MFHDWQLFQVLLGCVWVTDWTLGLEARQNLISSLDRPLNVPAPQFPHL